MTIEFKGILEVDEDRGVIYFHHETGFTVLRICGLPTPIPAKPNHLLDITHNVGVSWHAEQPRPSQIEVNTQGPATWT